MLKNAYIASPLSVSRESILTSATRYLKRLAGDDLLVSVDGMGSPGRGFPDLAFVKRKTGGIITAMVHRQGDFAGFALRAAAYHHWLKDCAYLGESILGRAIGLETCIISPDIPPADDYLLKVISDFSGLLFIRYQVLEVEEQQTPIVRFHLVEMKPNRENRRFREKACEAAAPISSLYDRPSEFALSSHEIEEFSLLKERHLK